MESITMFDYPDWQLYSNVDLSVKDFILRFIKRQIHRTASDIYLKCTRIEPSIVQLAADLKKVVKSSALTGFENLYTDLYNRS